MRPILAGKRLLEKLKSCPVRCCYSLHRCCLCKGDIRYPQLYHDNGWAYRAHVGCVNTELREG